ncbi:MAG: BREX system ATP-binding domain-containing protein, partial [Pseudonocardia sp.]
GLVERFVSQATTEARESGAPVESVIRTRLASLREMTGGYDFADVVAKYWQGHDTGDEQLQADAVRWLRGEFATCTDARAALGVRTIVDDAGFYDQLKIMSRLVKFAGYRGLLVCLDEMVNLYKIVNTQSRNANYEQVLRIVNDSLQGSAAHLAFVFGGTPVDDQVIPQGLRSSNSPGLARRGHVIGRSWSPGPRRARVGCGAGSWPRP